MHTKKRFELWMENVTDTEMKSELDLIKNDEKEIYERFYTSLSFGTAGLRGVLAVGDNRMNIYTVRRTTQGLANYLLSVANSPSVAIAYDSRHKSDVFAKEISAVFAANNIKVHLFSELAATPLLSWAVRELGCTAGIVVTASHNPAAYNGYKVYGEDGCQITSRAANAILTEVDKVDIFSGVKVADFDEALKSGDVSYIPDEIYNGYIKRVMKCSLNPNVIKESGLSLVFTPLCGTGNKPVREVLALAKLTKLSVVKEQEHPDGDFKTCTYPNPESHEAMALGIKLLEETKSDILIGTDPDADRVGVGVFHNNAVQMLNGNQVGVLLCDYIACILKKSGKLPDRPVMVKSIVSSNLAKLVAAEYGVEMIDVLTGFKYIGGEIAKLEKHNEGDRFVFGFEESCGYLIGGYVRDKDAISGALIVAEMAAYHKAEGRTLIDVLENIQLTHGFFHEKVESIDFEGSDGMAKMAQMMEQLFQNPITELGGYHVKEFKNLRDRVSIKNGEKMPISLPSSPVVILILENDATVIIRPSGTEPKLKIYYMCSGKTKGKAVELYSELQIATKQLINL